MNARTKTTILCLLQLLSMNCKVKVINIPGVQVYSSQPIKETRNV